MSSFFLGSCPPPVDLTWFPAFFSSHPTSHTKREERLNSGSRGGSFEGAINRRRHSPAVAKTRQTLSYKVALSLERHFEAIPPFPNAHGYIFHRKAHPFKFPNRRGEFFEVTRSPEYELSSPAVEQKYALLGLGWSNEDHQITHWPLYPWINLARDYS